MLRKITLLLVMLLACAYGQEEALLAIVGKEVITLYDVRLNSAVQEADLARQYHGKALQDKILEVRRAILDKMIAKELAYLEFKELKATVPAIVFQERLNAIILARANGDVMRFEDLLMQEGHTIKEFKDRLMKDISAELLIRERTQRGNQITTEQIQAYYEEHKNEAKIPARYHIAVIMLRQHGKYEKRLDSVVKEIYGKLKEGAAFSQLAKEYSEGANAEEGGDQGWLRLLVPRLQEALEKLQPGQISAAPVQIGDNHYIIHLIELEAASVRPLEAQLRENIRRFLEKQEEQRRYNDFIRSLYIKYPVRRMDN